MQIPNISNIASQPSLPGQSVDALRGLQSDVLGRQGNAAPDTSFSDLMKGLVETANQDFQATDKAIADLDSGKSEDLNTVVMATVKADLSFRFLMEMRNRVTASYQELSRMQF